MQDLEKVLAERGKNYGDFKDQADLSQKLKELVITHMITKNQSGAAKYTPYMAESMEIILHKIARIANGDPTHADSWLDIAGYARLVSDQIPVVGVDRAVFESGLSTTQSAAPAALPDDPADLPVPVVLDEANDKEKAAR